MVANNLFFDNKILILAQEHMPQNEKKINNQSEEDMVISQ